LAQQVSAHVAGDAAEGWCPRSMSHCKPAVERGKLQLFAAATAPGGVSSSSSSETGGGI
jgi:hypothetical protein